MFGVDTNEIVVRVQGVFNLVFGCGLVDLIQRPLWWMAGS